MSLPQVNLTTGHTTWVPPTTGSDGQPLTGGDVVTGYIVGLRSLTAVGSTAGTYSIQSPITAPSATSEALTAITASLKADQYAAAVQAQSANGASAWSTEFDFQGILPVPLAPSGVSVA